MLIKLQSGRIIDPSRGLDEAGDLFIEGDRLVSDPGRAPDHVVDAAGLWVVPGLIDLHAHLREPGEEYKEDLASGTRAAAAGGFTAVVCMPNTRPANDTRAVTEMIVRRAKEAGVVHVYPAAAVTVGRKGEQLTEMADLLEAGAVAFTDDGSPIATAGILRCALEYASTFDAVVMDHAEERSLTAEGVAHEGAVATRLGLPGWPSVGEDLCVARDVLVAEYLGARIHIQHVSSKGAVEIIRAAKARGVRVTAEVTPHHLVGTDAMLEGYPQNAKVNPPLRSEDHRAALRAALAEGVLDVVATDHAPHSLLEKEVEFGYAAFGVSGLETALPLCLELVSEGILSPSRLVEAMSTRPAAVLGLPGGTLAPGSRADVTLVDPEAAYAIDPTTFRSRGRNTPFAGREVRGRAAATFVAGRAAHWALPGQPPESP